MAKYQKYVEYKDSGVQWIGGIPQNWHFLRGKWKFRSLKEVNRNLQCMERLALTMNGVIERSIDSDEGLQPAEFSGYQIFEKNDLVFKLIDLENFKTSRVGLVFKKGIMSPAYIRLQPFKDTNSKFFYYFYFDLYLRGVYNQIGGQGVRSALNATDLLEIEVCVPSISEQRKIADFLDHETAKIDSLIAKQKKLIELLKEKRQAVISYVVTKGLNPKVPMKDSGNIWAEKIPNHWKLTKLTYVARVGNGATPSRDNEAYWKDGSIGWLNSSKVNDVIITEADQFITPLAKTQTSVQIVQPNDLVMAITGEGQTRGRVAICQLDATINQHLASIRITDKNLNHEFLFCWLTANYERIRYESTGAGSTKGAITCGDIGLYPVPLPPYAEQLEIVANIKKQSDTFKRLIVKAESAIQLMQERRTALISSAVTGKIDVRNWQDPNYNNNEANTELGA